MINFKIIAVDFDGTLCENKWPDIGEPNTELINYLLEEQKMGSKIILWTCRQGVKLIKAITWCYEQGLVFDAINENLAYTIQLFGGDARKIFAHEYIDDRMCDKFKLPFEKEKDVNIALIDHKSGFIGVTDAIKKGE